MKVVIPLLVLRNLRSCRLRCGRERYERGASRSSGVLQSIRDPDPRVVPNPVRDLCALSRNIRNCQIYDGSVIER